MAVYEVKVHWGASSLPWNNDGTWMLGTRPNQDLLSVDIESNDNGETLVGQIAYCCEGPIDFKGVRLGANAYSVYVHWGSDPEWHEDGIWIIGGRYNQRCVKLNIVFNPLTREFNGDMNYAAEGPIAFKGRNLGNQSR